MAVQTVFRRYERKYLLIRRSIEKPAYKETLDWAAEVYRKLYDLGYQDPEYLHNAPHNAAIGRPDDVAASRNPIQRCQA